MLLSTPETQTNVLVVIEKCFGILKSDPHFLILANKGAEGVQDADEKIEIFRSMKDLMIYEIQRVAPNLGLEKTDVEKIVVDSLVIAALTKMYATINLSRANHILDNRLTGRVVLAFEDAHDKMVEGFTQELDYYSLDPLLRNLCVYTASQCGSLNTLKQFVWYIIRAVQLGVFIAKTDQYDYLVDVARALVLDAKTYGSSAVLDEYNIFAEYIVFRFEPYDLDKESWSVNDHFVGSEVCFEIQRSTTDFKVSGSQKGDGPMPLRVLLHSVV